MKDNFEMSIMGEMKFFLGLQVHQLPCGIFINQSQYPLKLLKKHARPTEKHLKEVKRIFCYFKQSIKMGLWYSKDSGFELIAYSDADHAGCHDDCKSTSGGIQFLGDKLVSLSSKNMILQLCQLRKWSTYLCLHVVHKSFG
ncbi:hypothetical protein Tco_0243645 [Tanacetum coccineum]